MADELFISGKNFVSSKKAAVLTGYAQDYIGQLSRGGLIEAQRVGGLWYVNLESLKGYKTNAADFKPAPPTISPAQDPESIVSFDGKDYISASRAAKITGYNQDYIGQLARSGKIVSRQIGNRWYVDRSGLLGHKTEKDRLLANVQSESVGLRRAPATAEAAKALSGEYAGAGPVLTYFKDDGDLMPVMDAREPSQPTSPARTPLASHTLALSPLKKTSGRVMSRSSKKGGTMPIRTSGQTMFSATKAMVALTVVIVLSYGIVSIKDGSVYALFSSPDSTVVERVPLLASASSAFARLGDILEKFLTKELVYRAR